MGGKSRSADPAVRERPAERRRTVPDTSGTPGAGERRPSASGATPAAFVSRSQRSSRRERGTRSAPGRLAEDLGGGASGHSDVAVSGVSLRTRTVVGTSSEMTVVFCHVGSLIVVDRTHLGVVLMNSENGTSGPCPGQYDGPLVVQFPPHHERRACRHPLTDNRAHRVSEAMTARRPADARRGRGRRPGLRVNGAGRAYAC